MTVLARIRVCMRHLAMVAVCTVACGACSPSSNDAASSALPDGFEPFVEQRWSLEAASTGYACGTTTLAKDLWITGFRALTPSGTHHVIVSLADDTGVPARDCARGNLDPRVLFATGSASRGFDLPSGVALHLHAGQVLHVGIHTVNATNDRLEGLSGVSVSTVDASLVRHEAEVVLAGSRTFAIPARALEYVVRSEATIAEETQLVALSSVMHRLGSSQRVSVLDGQDERVLHDALFTFGEERVVAFDEVTLSAGARLAVRCTFDNVSTELVSGGIGASNELCLASVYRYPATGGDPYAWVQ